MKLKHLIWGGLAAWTSYQLVNHRQTITKEFRDTQQLSKEAKASYDKIQDRLHFIQSQMPLVKDMAQSLSYKLNVFQEEFEVRVEQMPLVQKNKNISEKAE